MTKKNVLKAEETINNILIELENMEKALNTIDSMRESANKSVNSSKKLTIEIKNLKEKFEKLIKANYYLNDQGEEILDELREIELDENLNELRKEILKIQKQVNSLAIEEHFTKLQTKLNNYFEEFNNQLNKLDFNLKEFEKNNKKIHKRNRALIVVVLFFQLIILILNFL